MTLSLFIMNKIENIFGKESLSKRFQIFLCDILCMHGLPVDYKVLQNDQTQNIVVDFINKNRAIVSYVAHSSCSFVDEFYFQWINEKNTRQMRFVIEKIQKRYPIPKQFSLDLLGIHLIYFLMDALPLPKKSKLDIINSIKGDWNDHLSKDKIFRWFREDANSKIEFTWDWLCKRKPVMMEKEKPFECLADILIFFDGKIENYVERDHYIEIIKRNWKQCINRDKPSAKKQCNILLSKNTINILDELCDHYRLKKQDLIEILILSEHQNRTHLKQVETLPIYHSEIKINNTKPKKS